jgi:hypothetical protein
VDSDVAIVLPHRPPELKRTGEERCAFLTVEQPNCRLAPVLSYCSRFQSEREARNSST